MQNDGRARRSMLSGVGAAVAAFVLGSRQAGAQAAEAVAKPPRHAQDDWLDAVPGAHRTFIDTANAEGAAMSLRYATNLYTANQSAYSLTDRDVAIVVCFRHLSTVFGFNDAMWAKYGKPFAERADFMDPKTKQAPLANLLNAADYPMLPNGGVTIDSMVKRGTHFAICSMATRNMATRIAASTGGNVEAIVKELMANGIANSHFVAAGVVAVNRAQERGYTLLSA